MSGNYFSKVNAALDLLDRVTDPELRKALETALFDAADEVKKAEALQRNVAYLAECQAATAEHAAYAKSTSKSERARQADLCGIAIGILEGTYLGPSHPKRGTVEEVREIALNRLRSVRGELVASFDKKNGSAS